MLPNSICYCYREDVKPRKPWLINKSVYEPRRRESDAKAYLDTGAVEKAAFMSDVMLIFSKPSFITFFNGTCGAEAGGRCTAVASR